MKYLLSFLYCITSICSAMENKWNIIAELTCVSKPTHAGWLTGDLVIIAGNNGGSICNYRTNTEIAKICTWDIPKGRIPDIVIHPNKKIIALNDFKENVIVYDTQTQEKYTTKSKNPCNLVFNPINNTIFVQERYTQITEIHDYKNKSETAYFLKESPNQLEIFHPTQPNIYLSRKNDTLFTLTWNKNSFSAKEVIRNKINNVKNIYDCKYSPDGSLIIMNSNSSSLTTFDLKSKEHKTLQFSYNYHIWAMVFHPTSFILAALSPQSPATICYWNTKTQSLITTDKLFEENNASNYCGNRIDFSSDGEKIIVVVNDKCLIMEVPFKVLYKDITKEQAIFMYWSLKIFQKSLGTIPDEIIYLLLKKVLMCSKYSLSNY